MSKKKVVRISFELPDLFKDMEKIKPFLPPSESLGLNLKKKKKNGNSNNLN